MRLGKKAKNSKAWKKAGDAGKPKYVSRESVVGQVTSDVVSTVYAPRFVDAASETLERYAEEMMQYDELLQAFEKNAPNMMAEAEIDQDGAIHSATEKPIEPKAPFFDAQFRVDEFSELFTETSEHFFAKSGGWRVHANAAKFERLLDEKYGIFRPFMTEHPEVEQFIRSVQRKYAMGQFSPLRRGDPPIPRSTAVILLFLMQRGKVQWGILILAALFFLVGLQPWALVAIVALVQGLMSRRRNQPVGFMKSDIDPGKPYYRLGESSDKDSSAESEEQDRKRKYELLTKPVGSPLKEAEVLDASSYDAILLGTGPGCLYAAALLSRAGRRVLVLSTDADASGCATCGETRDKRFQDVPFDLGASNVSKITRQQKLLAPALCTETDCQGGVRFAQIGSQADGFAFEILSVPGVGTDRRDQHIPFLLKAAGGVGSLMEDAAMFLGDGYPGADGAVGHSTTGAFVNVCKQMNNSAGEYYLSKVLPESSEKYRSTSVYQKASTQFAERVINQSFPLNAHTRSLMAAVGLKSESLRPSKASMAVHVTNVCAAMSGEGMHYPVGGPRALCHALASVVEQSGGRIVTKTTVAELLFVEDEEGKNAPAVAVDETQTSKLPPPTCVGVKLASGQEVRFAEGRFTVEEPERPVVVSMLPFISTFLRMFPSDIRTKYGCPRGLGALAEQRPVFKLMLGLDGSASDLSLTGADYYRVPSAALALDEIDPATNTVQHGEMGWADEDERTVAADTDGADVQSQEVDDKKRKTSHQKRFEPGVSWIHISFPSAKDPSFTARHGNISTCVVTVEADDDFVIDMGSKPRMFSTKKLASSLVENMKRLREHVIDDVVHIFPQLEGKIKCEGMTGPTLRGMSHTPHRFVAKGVRADTPYKGLYYGGSDLTIGESFSASMVAAWLVSNAVAGYTTMDHLFLQKNITADLGRFITSTGVDDDDVAVPYLLDTDGGGDEPESSS